MSDATLQIQAKVNQLDTFKYAFEAMFIDKLIERMDQNQEIFEKNTRKSIIRQSGKRINDEKGVCEDE
jgi:hypothetical protein